MLGKIVKRDSVPDLARALFERQHPGQYFQQRAFPGAILTHQRDPLASLHCEVQRAVNHLFAVALRDAFKFQHVPTAGRGKGEFEAHAFGVALPLD